MDTSRAQEWWTRHAVTAITLDRYLESETRPYRAHVLRAFEELGPWHSLFEIGCGVGSMLAVIQRAFPLALLVGCEINAAMAEHARDQWPGVMMGPFPEATVDWPDRCVDVVLSCYALAYVAPADLKAALAEAGRLCRRGVVMCEPVAWNLEQAGQRGAGEESLFVEWRHPYLWAMNAIPGFSGWTAHCWNVEYQDNLLSGVIAAVRPGAQG